ncbi:helix-turn-helix transcriptional regulator [Microlunatus elymi]|uniref:Helix-turn-helix transcriptional regulator n=1 Tax=Microlunatus elymi TaxID=2596828 RepID=A0A516PTU8_9ACTN|nr:helix-turn-helix domain-containing protein [Microlunatus elymi]QDP94607.1 helix-turn-helix transcriptional regulator [Microlunatus elymi]
MALGSGYDAQDCAVARALEVVGERWTMLIIRDCFLGVRRFSDLQAHLDISKAVLTDRLNRLVEQGVLERDGDRGHQEYLLTKAGRALAPVLATLSYWGRTYGNPDERPTRQLVHSCGAELDANGRCGPCDVTPRVAEMISRPDPNRPSRRNDFVTRQLAGDHRLLDPIRP